MQQCVSIIAVVFIQVYKLKAENSQLKNELRKLKDKYHSLSQDFEKSIFNNEAEEIMDQLEEILTETKSNLEKLPHFQKLSVHMYVASYVLVQYM